MRILYYSDSVTPVNNAAAVRSDILIKELRKANHMVECFYSHGGNSSGSNGFSLFFKTASNQASFARRLLLETLVGIELAIRLALKKSDLVFLSSPPFITNVIAALSLIALRKPYIFEIRDPYPEVYFQHRLIKPNSFGGRFLISLTKMVYSHAYRIIAATLGIRDIVLAYGIESQKIAVIKNGFDENLFKPSTSKWPRFTCIFHGNLGHMQNIDLLLAVANSVKNKQQHLPETKQISFVVYGDGSQKAKLSKSNAIEYRGPANYTELCELLAKAHVGLSFREDGTMGQIALPVKVFEYIGSGLPTILAPISEAGVMLLESKLGLQFRNDQIEEISAALLELQEQGRLYRNFHESIALHRSEFSRQKQAAQLVEILSNNPSLFR